MEAHRRLSTETLPIDRQITRKYLYQTMFLYGMVLLSVGQWSQVERTILIDHLADKYVAWLPQMNCVFVSSWKWKKGNNYAELLRCLASFAGSQYLQIMLMMDFYQTFCTIFCAISILSGHLWRSVGWLCEANCHGCKCSRQPFFWILSLIHYLLKYFHCNRSHCNRKLFSPATHFKPWIHPMMPSYRTSADHVSVREPIMLQVHIGF